MTADATALLGVVKPFGVTGLSMMDPADATTWAFTPTELSPEQCAAATAAIRAALQPPPVQITKIAFLRLLQPGEWVAFAKGAETDPTLMYAKALLDAALSLTPTEPTFLQMLAYCVGIGLFTQARADAIVAGMQP